MDSNGYLSLWFRRFLRRGRSRKYEKRTSDAYGVGRRLDVLNGIVFWIY